MKSSSYRAGAIAAAAACGLACALHAPIAGAQGEIDRFLLTMGYSSTWDDNVFRLPEGAPDPQGNGRSDRYSTATVGLRVNLPISMQRLLVDVTRSAVRYDRFSSRDQDPFSYRGAWQWQLTPRISGTLNANRQESDVNIEDVVSRRSITQRSTTVSATADAWLTGGWHLLGGATDSETKYSEPFLARPDTKQKAAEVGLRHTWASTSQLTLTRRTSRGTETVTDAAVLGGSDFTQDETEVAATWVATGRSTLNARITRIKRENEVLPQRNFSGTAGDLRYLWWLTGRANLNLSATRSISPYNLTLESTTLIDHTFAAALTWTTSERTSIRPAASRRISRYGQVSTSLEARRDTVDSFEIGATWSPRRYVSLTARLAHETRDSTEAPQIYDANIGTLGVTLTF